MNRESHTSQTCTVARHTGNGSHVPHIAVAGVVVQRLLDRIRKLGYATASSHAVTFSTRLANKRAEEKHPSSDTSSTGLEYVHCAHYHCRGPLFSAAWCSLGQGGVHGVVISEACAYCTFASPIVCSVASLRTNNQAYLPSRSAYLTTKDVAPLCWHTASQYYHRLCEVDQHTSVDWNQRKYGQAPPETPPKC